MSARTRLLLIIGIPVLVVLVVVGIFLWQRPQASPVVSNSTGPLTKVRLALDFTQNPNHSGVYVAKEKGWYKNAGIDLEILPFSPNAFPDVLVTSGKADVAISSTESVVIDAAMGQPIVSIAAITAHNTSVLAVRADAAIASPRDLDGKIYGGYGAPYEQPIVSQAIKFDGGKGEFRSVTLGTDAIQALASRQIDFAWVFGLDVVQAERQGVKLKTFPITKYGVPDYYAPTFVTSPQMIKEKKELLQKFMSATRQGYEYAHTHAKEAAALLVQGSPKGTFSDTAQVEASQNFLSPLYVENGKWGVQRASAWQDYVSFILKTGSVKDASGKTVTQLDSQVLFTNQFVQ